MPTVPRDENATPLQIVPSYEPLAKTYVSTSTGLASATNITLNSSTKLIEVSALGAPVFVRFSSTASSSNYSRFVQPGTTRHFWLPLGTTVVSVIQETATAGVVVLEF